LAVLPDNLPSSGRARNAEGHYTYGAVRQLTESRNSEPTYPCGIGVKPDSVSSSAGFTACNHGTFSIKLASRERAGTASPEPPPFACKSDFVVEMMSPSDRLKDAKAAMGRIGQRRPPWLAYRPKYQKPFTFTDLASGAVQHDNPAFASGDPVRLGFTATFSKCFFRHGRITTRPRNNPIKFMPTTNNAPIQDHRSRPCLSYQGPECQFPPAMCPRRRRRASAKCRASTEIPLPELELEIVRHFTHISSLNYHVDKGFYPLGSCTMKYNPKINDQAVNMPRSLRVSNSISPKAQGRLKSLLTYRTSPRSPAWMRVCSILPQHTANFPGARCFRSARTTITTGRGHPQVDPVPSAVTGCKPPFRRCAAIKRSASIPTGVW